MSPNHAEVPVKADPWIDRDGGAHRREAVLDDGAVPEQWTIVLQRPADGDTLSGLAGVRLLVMRLKPGTTAAQAHALAEHMALADCLEAIHEDPAPNGGGVVLPFRMAA